MKLSEDQLAMFEHRVRTEGVWCDTRVTDKIAHFMVCKHPRSSIAISRCGMIVKPFEALHENTVAQRCLVCALFEQSGKEVREHNDQVTSTVLEKYVDDDGQTDDPKP